MKLKKVEIDGFGKLVNRSYELEDLTVFMGANEAGKSTLLSFIKYMIFGFEKKTTKNRDFSPRDSRVYGGRLYLEIDGQDLMIERISLSKSGTPNFTCSYLSDARKLSEDEWLELLSPMTPKLFDQIYSISQDNLQINRERDYNEASLEEKWRMAITTGTVELYKQEEELIKEKNSLYTSPKALSKPLNQTLHALEQIKSEIFDKEAEEAALAPLIKEGKKREDEIRESRLKLVALEEERRILEAKLAFENDYLEFSRLEASLREQEKTQGTRDYESLLASYHDFEILQTRIGRLEDKIESNKSQLEKFDNPLDNFLLEGQTRDAIKQIEFLYPKLVGRKEKEVKVIQRNNSFLLLLMLVTLVTLGFLILVPAGLKIFLSILLIFEIISGVAYLLVTSKRRGELALEAKNSQIARDYFALTDIFKGWYQLPESIEGRYALVLKIKERILELDFNYKNLDSQKDEYLLENLYTKSDLFLQENPQVDQIQEEIKNHENFIQQKKYLGQLRKRLEQVLDLDVEKKPDFDEIDGRLAAINQKIDEFGDKLGRQIDQNSLILAKIDQRKSDESLENLYQKLELKRGELSDMISLYLLKAGQIESLKAATKSLSTHSLPEILRRAGHYMSILTDGSWQELGISNGLLEISGPGPLSMRLLDLSTGTRDQLQLAVRLAFIEAKNLNFPVFFDDSFLRYDQKRKENFIKLLEEFSSKVQTFVFTSDEKFRNQGDLIEL
ncbi:AAA family ATPase [Streptococcaceae bacterium ESL0729]|nr:AAA family ATPase [Streptococcaceae bacterium ESL0729]